MGSLDLPTELFPPEIQVPEERGGSESEESFWMQPWQVRDSGESHTWPMSTEKKQNSETEVSGLSIVAHSWSLTVAWAVKAEGTTSTS